jgi:phosphoribosyl-dephospho-CoA transferase
MTHARPRSPSRPRPGPQAQAQAPPTPDFAARAHPRPHDILELRRPDALDDFESAPAWVRDSLDDAPFAIVRRVRLAADAGAPSRRGATRGERDTLAVGVRGPARDQRWACTVDAHHVLRVLRPPDLLVPRDLRGASRHESPRGLPLQSPRWRDVPALRELRALMAKWRNDIGYAWGPSGSVGFEIATGVACVTPSSDLDIVIYADTPMTRDQALRLHASLADSLTRVDVLVETPHCGFSLAEYATAAATATATTAASATDCLLLRTPHGPRLGRDPWSPSPSTPAPRSPSTRPDGVSA